MVLHKLLGVVSASGLAATFVAYARYRKDIRFIRDKVELGSTIAETIAAQSNMQKGAKVSRCSCDGVKVAQRA